MNFWIHLFQGLTEATTGMIILLATTVPIFGAKWLIEKLFNVSLEQAAVSSTLSIALRYKRWQQRQTRSRPIRKRP